MAYIYSDIKANIDNLITRETKMGSAIKLFDPNLDGLSNEPELIEMKSLKQGLINERTSLEYAIVIPLRSSVISDYNDGVYGSEKTLKEVVREIYDKINTASITNNMK